VWPQQGSTAGGEQIGLLDAGHRFESSSLCDAARSCDKALAVQVVVLASDRTTRTGSAPVLDESSNEVGMHGGSFYWE
jgi:hypothetical protein